MLSKANTMKIGALVVCCLCFASVGWSQTTGRLTVSGTIQGSIGLVFDNNAQVGTTGFCALGNAGTNNVTLDFGSASFTTGDTQSCVQFTRFLGFYIVSSGFDVVVSKANTTSMNYQLAASISPAPPTNVFWTINTTTFLNATPQTFQSMNNYGRVTETLGVVVNQNVTGQTLFETINFLATAN